MEGSHDSYLASTSLRGSISRWRTSSVGAFSKSLREEDDEEALKWAALEKLPTYNRLRKGLLTTSRGEAFEVDVSNLGLQQRQRLINKLVKVTEVDNEKFLLKLKSRIDRVGIDLPKVEVRYEHLNVEGEAYLARHLQLSRHSSQQKETLDNPQGCEWNHKARQVSGRVTYNGHDMGEFVPERTAAYISQHDNHIGEMTVRETLAFSARCQGVGSRYELLTELARRENEAGIKPDPDIDVYMKVLGLEVCADTMVGDEMIRGISGGERKRVTTGEMMVGPALALFMDEISTGLDSSTTFQIVNCLKQHIHINSGTTVISLLQPAPETYDLFDDIILLSDGQIVYQGPRELVLEFFESMGFKCPKRKGVADFLQEVTSRKDQKQYWTHKEKPYRFVTVEEFAEAFQSFHVGQKISDELRTPFDKSKSHRAALTTEVYGAGKRELLKTCISRELLLMKRNSFVYIFKLTQISSVALAFMTLFFRTKMHKHSLTDGGIYAGALFFATAMVMFNGLAEISMTIAKLPVFYKQRDFRFFPPWAYAIPSWILKIPISFLEVAVWVFLTYYVIGCDPNAGRFFKQYLLFLAVNQMASALFRLIAATGRSMVVANTFGTFALLVLFALGGFVLSREDIKKWWKWAYWCSPMSYAQNAIVANEFLGYSWKKFTPNSYESIGVQVLKSRGFFAHAYCGRNSSSKSLILTEAQGSHPKKRGMILPFEPHSLTFDEVVYSVDMPQEMKLQGVLEDKLVLLNGLSGAFRPGVLTALMGVSGAGKTTLMDVLSGRKTGGYITGNITISGYPKKQETFARISGYCEQNDIHSPFVTVYESLLYSAWLRLPPEVDSETRKMFIEEVMELVELKPLIQSLVGLPGVSGLSTEQRKRLTIAVELVANPSIIFMDEPTSGLDARAAAIVMRTVRNTVDTGRTVVCTIHQPGIDIFDAFDELFLMKRGGQEIYVGPLGRHSCQLISYFEAIPGVEKIKDGYNPATWMLEVTASSQEVALGVDFNDIFRCSELYRRNKALIEELSKPTPGSKDLYFPTQYSQSAFTQFMACLWKQHWSYWRNPQYTAVRFFFTAFIAVLLGSLFWDMGSKTRKSQDLFNAMGSMFTAIIFLGLQYCSSVQPVVSVERTVFYREKAAGMYSGLPWALAQAMIEIPYIFVQSVVYCVIVYAMMGYDWTAEKFSWYFFFMYITLLLFTFYGMLTVAITPNHHIAAIVSTLFYGIWYLFCGFVIPRPRIPVWWRWYYWANPVAWTLYGLIASQFGDVEDQMENGETVKHFLRDYFGFKHDFLGLVAGASLFHTSRICIIDNVK
ncbi:hypothetical protein WN943_022384 [Citrus x changshan-huyou]